jgi:hypothetical protein
LNTGEKRKHDHALGATIDVSCCDSFFPVICQKCAHKQHMCLVK